MNTFLVANERATLSFFVARNAIAFTLFHFLLLSTTYRVPRPSTKRTLLAVCVCVCDIYVIACMTPSQIHCLRPLSIKSNASTGIIFFIRCRRHSFFIIKLTMASRKCQCRPGHSVWLSEARLYDFYALSKVIIVLSHLRR